MIWQQYSYQNSPTHHSQIEEFQGREKMYTLFAIVLLIFVSGSNAGPSYIGCFEDKGLRILEGKMTTGDMTVEKCVQRCSMEGEKLAGVEYSNQCFCGSKQRPYAKVDEKECNHKCKGNSNQNCGGFWKISLYETHTYLGCYVDSSTRILSGKSMTDDKMTTAKCINFCKKNKQQYAMTQYSKQCFCGNSLKKEEKKPDSECSYDCAGAKSEKCGGFWRGSLYLAV